METAGSRSGVKQGDFEEAEAEVLHAADVFMKLGAGGPGGL
jgi:hypothetical protein